MGRCRPCPVFILSSVACLSVCRMETESDSTRRSTGGEVKGKEANGVGSQHSCTVSEHRLSSITTADAHTSAASSRLNGHPRQYKWTRPFRWKTKSGFCACAITYRFHSTIFATYLINGTILWGRLLTIKCVFWIAATSSRCVSQSPAAAHTNTTHKLANVFSFSLQRLSETFLILSSIYRGTIINVCWSRVKYLLVLSDFSETWIFSTDFWKNPKYQI